MISRVSCAFFLCGLVTFQVQGAAITFTDSVLTGVGDLETGGVVYRAFNTGGGGAVVLGGVTYAPGGNPLSGGFTGANPGNVIGDANFDTLLNSASLVRLRWC